MADVIASVCHWVRGVSTVRAALGLGAGRERDMKLVLSEALLPRLACVAAGLIVECKPRM